MKKLASILLSFALVFSLIIPAFAESTAVGQLTIFCMSGNQAFLSFKSTYSEPIRIGGLSVNNGSWSLQAINNG